MTEPTPRDDPQTPTATLQAEEGHGPRFSYAVAALERSIRRSLAAVLQEFDLTVAQYTSLSLIRRNAGYTNAQLARRSFVSPQAMHEVTSELEARGLLERARTEAHRTVRLTYLTPAGGELLDRCDTAVDVMEEAMLAGLPGDWATEAVPFLIGAARRLGGGTVDD